jgi:predicted DCC family thiol-disulfide oxidoreductase YuxK
MTDVLTVLYDADCGICTQTARLLARIDNRRRLNLVALQVADLPGMPPRETLGESLHAVDTAGRWLIGAEASVAIARRVPLLAPIGVAARMPGAMTALDALYRAVARNRQRISRMLGLQVCRVPERHAERRSS